MTFTLTPSLDLLPLELLPYCQKTHVSIFFFCILDLRHQIFLYINLHFLNRKEQLPMWGLTNNHRNPSNSLEAREMLP